MLETTAVATGVPKLLSFISVLLFNRLISCISKYDTNLRHQKQNGGFSCGEGGAPPTSPRRSGPGSRKYSELLVYIIN